MPRCTAAFGGHAFHRYTVRMITGEIGIEGRRLEVARWGEAPLHAPALHGPALVLLHEGLGCVALWRDFPARLAAATGCGVFAWSRLGYGGSDPAELPRPLDYMEREATSVVSPVLDAAGIGACILVGHSDGASIAAYHGGVVRDARVRGLVLIAPHYFVEEMCLASIAAARQAYEEGDLRRRLARHHANVDNAFHGWNGAWLDPRFRTEFDIRPALAGIEVPVLQIQGDADPYGTAAQTEAGERGAPGRMRTLMLPGVRHAPHVEAPDATVAAIAGFASECLHFNASSPGEDPRFTAS